MTLWQPFLFRSPQRGRKIENPKKMKNTKEAMSYTPSEPDTCMISPTHGGSLHWVCKGLGLMSSSSERRRGLKPTSTKQNVCPIDISII